MKENPAQNKLEKAKAIFRQEVQQRLPECQEALSFLKSNGYDAQACETIYRFAHTLKGSGQMVGWWDIADPAAEMATALILLKNYGVEFSTGILNFLNERLEEILNEMNGSSEITSSIDPFTQTASTPKILIVDDDPTITHLVAESLEQNGFEAIVCHDLVTAEQQLRLVQPDLIVLDIILPQESGIEFCRKIRSDPQWRIVPVIFLSVKDQLQDKLAGFSTGADDYICKPFKVEELIARIRAILNRINICHDLIWRDELTHVYNRRYLQQRLKEERSLYRSSGKGFSLAMIDLDFFKEINDRYGHIVGDETLQCLVDKLIANLRTSDVICRYGGEEFVIIMPDTSKAEAHSILDRVLHLIGQTPLDLPKSKRKIGITISGGCVHFPQNGANETELLKAADTALYTAKKNGRNQFVFMSEVEK